MCQTTGRIAFNEVSCLAAARGILVAIGIVSHVCVASAQVNLLLPTHRLTASDAAPNDQFGSAVAISGNLAVVGTPVQSAAAGASYIYDVTTGVEITKLTGTGTSTLAFGHSVAIDGDSVIVGAPLEGDSGAAYLFSAATGGQQAKLVAEDGSHLGDSVALNDGKAIVGASLSHNAAVYTGSAYVFDTATGIQHAKLIATDGATFDSFGGSVSMSGNTAIVGAPRDDDVGKDSGSAYLFDVTTGNQIRKLLASDGEADDKFGTSVAISGNVALVGAPYVNSDESGFYSGAAYLFDVATGNQLAKLTASDAAVRERFGISVAISGNIAVIGADMDNAIGAAYVFNLSTRKQVAKLVVPELEPFEFFGGSVSINSRNVIVGSLGEDGDAGAAYLFQVVPEPACVAIVPIALLGNATHIRRRRKSHERLDAVNRRRAMRYSNDS